MDEQPRDSAAIAESWSAYWRGARGARDGEDGHVGQAWSSGGSGHPAVAAFWQEVFAFARDLNPSPRLLDLASGSGAVADAAAAAFEAGSAAITCVDISPAAVEILGRRHPEAGCLVADARALPFPSGSFDVVTSQFGIEYAGAEALDEALRTVSAGGLLALLVHCRDGLIHRRCRASRDAIAAMQRAEFLSRSRMMFEAAFAALTDEGARERYREAGRALAPAIGEVEGILARYGREVADETIVRVYRDIRDIHGRLAHHDPEAVLDWLHRMEVEIAAYHGRMESMCGAAIDEDEFRRWCARCDEAGFDVIRAEPLRVEGGDVPLALGLVARRR